MIRRGDRDVGRTRTERRKSVIVMKADPGFLFDFYPSLFFPFTNLGNDRRSTRHAKVANVGIGSDDRRGSAPIDGSPPNPCSAVILSQEGDPTSIGRPGWRVCQRQPGHALRKALVPSRFSPQLPSSIDNDRPSLSKQGKHHHRDTIAIRVGIGLPNLESCETSVGGKGISMLARCRAARGSDVTKTDKILR